ncbi:MAG: ribosome small subunit-dependent GTPase A [Bacteroidetes bacterium 46-16]|nr:MAG: ribosome small subunit-dependent GTPase A [Bacteroidetes bacterium 46-16]
MQGLVYRSTGSWYSVRDEQGLYWNARVKGKLKIDEDISSTNPIAVGDVVQFDVEDDTTKTAMVTNVNDRHNYIVRVSPHNRNQKHIVAANLDLALVMATIAEPRTSNGFIDRFLLTAEVYHIPAVVVINKIDLLKPKHKEQLEHWQEMYESIGYEVYPIIALEHDSVLALEQRLAGKTTLFSGHSGVGKSTLINQLIPDLDLRTKEVSGWSGKGQHTTTFAEMFDTPAGGRIIDTPGVKEFGIIDVEKEELSHYFPEMRKLLTECRFNNCLHINEPGCAVKRAVMEGTIAEDRYISYVTILDTIGKKW